MTQKLEADVALLNIAGGGSRITPPPGTLALVAPRRAARGRSEDMLLLNISLQGARSPSPGLLDHLAREAADAYFGTPGSVTSALREGAESANDHLADLNQLEDATDQLQGRMIAGVLRDGDLYIAQCGVGQAILVRPGQVIRLTSEEATHRPLGLSLSPYVRYHHLAVNPGDLLILTTASPPLWSDTTLSGLSSLDPEQAADRLIAASSVDLSGVLTRLVARGEGITTQDMQALDISPGTQMPPRTLRARPRASSRAARAYFGSISENLLRARERITAAVSTMGRGLSGLAARLAPGLGDAPPPGVLSTRLLIGTAVAVPLIVVAIAAAAYFGRGRRQQFDEYFFQAAAAIQIAQMKPDAEKARVDWESALNFLELAKDYGWNKEADAMWQEAQNTLDSLDLIARLGFQPVVSGGFGTDAFISSLAATETDLYVLDAAHQILWHARGTPERGYKIDATFECLDGPNRYPELGSLVDIVIQAEPGALGREGVVGVDVAGTLLYCAPERQPAIAQLTPPDIGWGRIRAIDVFEDSLYVMDPTTNAVWIYNASGGLFSGMPELYFVEEVRDLSGAIDMAMAGDELFILYADGRLDRCRRFEEADRIRVECDPEPNFQDDRPGREATSQIPGAVAAKLDYSPPPEPSLFFLDTFSNSVFHYSLRLVYQAKYIPTPQFEEEITALTLGPPNDLYLAAGSQVYHAIPSR
ncbi:MAG: hypothetical protein GTO14_21465 [Anaerolineales bacterium]|nr:hypothetical protein [Anaerolineales bacterium]